MYWALWKSPCYNLCVCVGGQGGMYCLWVTKILLICKDKISCVDTCTFIPYIFKTISYYHVCGDVRVVHEIYKQQWWFHSIWTVAFTSIGTECIGYSPLRLMCWLLARESFISSSNRVFRLSVHTGCMTPSRTIQRSRMEGSSCPPRAFLSLWPAM